MNYSWKVLKKLAKSQPCFAAGVVFKNIGHDDMAMLQAHSHEATLEMTLKFHLIFEGGEYFSDDWMNEQNKNVRSCVAGDGMVAHFGFEGNKVGMIVEVNGDAFALFTENFSEGVWQFVSYCELATMPKNFR